VESSPRGELTLPAVSVRDESELMISFSIPIMYNPKSSEPIIHQLSHASLGARPHPNLAPRPLHNPMDDHAIVLYDPTIDDKPDPEEVEALQLEMELKKKEAEERGPHKSLKAILGIVDVKNPRLSKMLRPHQIEGVKVSIRVDLMPGLADT
jgi:DNA repair and recombination RAD54-like protein